MTDDIDHINAEINRLTLQTTDPRPEKLFLERENLINTVRRTICNRRNRYDPANGRVELFRQEEVQVPVNPISLDRNSCGHRGLLLRRQSSRASIAPQHRRGCLTQSHGEDSNADAGAAGSSEVIG